MGRLLLAAVVGVPLGFVVAGVVVLTVITGGGEREPAWVNKPVSLEELDGCSSYSSVAVKCVN